MGCPTEKAREGAVGAGEPVELNVPTSLSTVLLLLVACPPLHII